MINVEIINVFERYKSYARLSLISVFSSAIRINLFIKSSSKVISFFSSTF